MAVHGWWFEFNDFGAVVNTWTDMESGALRAWSMRIVDSLYYLADIDDRVFADAARPTGGHDEEAVNAGHVRWACGSAITALDLCAASIWRLTTPVPIGAKERSLRDFNPSSTQREITDRRSLVTPAHLGWIDSVFADPDYTAIVDVRHPLTHARLPQHVRVGHVLPGPHEDRNAFLVGAGRVQFDARDLIDRSVRLATFHVEGFLDSFVVPRPTQ